MASGAALSVRCVKRRASGKQIVCHARPRRAPATAPLRILGCQTPCSTHLQNHVGTHLRDATCILRIAPTHTGPRLPHHCRPRPHNAAAARHEPFAPTPLPAGTCSGSARRQARITAQHSTAQHGPHLHVVSAAGQREHVAGVGVAVEDAVTEDHVAQGLHQQQPEAAAVPLRQRGGVRQRHAPQELRGQHALRAQRAQRRRHDDVPEIRV